MKNYTLLMFCLFLAACSTDETTSSTPTIELSDYFSIDFDDLLNYENQAIPAYINRENTPLNNPITNEGATLGRILFYDNNLSTNNTTACASCHIQEHAFSDIDNVSQGANGTTARHSMRLINARFANEDNFFWDERASSLEIQTTMPIQDHAEMGFSGENGDPNFDDLITKLEAINYYPELFINTFGDNTITEVRIQNALAQFVRSIQSFDSKFDTGRALVNNNGQVFPNYTAQENNGKNLFLQPPNFNNQSERINGGLGCAACHSAPEFDIDPNSRNNGVIGLAGGNGIDLTITRAPSLRDLLKANGAANGPFMHIGVSNNFMTVLNHYNDINLAANTNLDPRLRPNGVGQKLNMSQQEKDDVFAFIKTLTGTNVYTDEKWSNPFLD